MVSGLSSLEAVAKYVHGHVLVVHLRGVWIDASRERDWVVGGEHQRARAHVLASRPSRVRSRSGRRPWGDAHVRWGDAHSTIPSTPDRLSSVE